jgi:hypothetical protein
VAAAFAAPTLTVTFDRALQPGALAPGNWSARFGNTLQLCSAANVGGPGNTQVICAMVADGLSIGANACTYTAAPADVISTAGIPAAAFMNFPIT